MNQPLATLHGVEEAVPFTVDEFMSMVLCGAFEGAGKVELIDGVIIRMAPALRLHMHYQQLISYELRDIYRDAGSSRMVQFELTLKLGPRTLRDADIGVLSRYDPHGDYVDVSTVLFVVEIAHTTRGYDLRNKRLDYARAGIPHYWVVDVEKRVTHLMSRPTDGDYAERPDPIPFGEPIAVPETDRKIVID